MYGIFVGLFVYLKLIKFNVLKLWLFDIFGCLFFKYYVLLKKKIFNLK